MRPSGSALPQQAAPGSQPQAHARLQPARQQAAGAPLPRMVPSAPIPAQAVQAAQLQAVDNDYAEAGYAEEQAEAPAPRLAAHQAGRPVQSARGNGRYAEEPAAEQAPQPARKSLFGIVTGAIRGSLPATAAGAPAQQVRAEPSLHEAMHDAPARPNVRQTAGEDMGIDIPAFLRRQTSAS
jgi:cell division protein FtsZ